MDIAIVAIAVVVVESLSVVIAISIKLFIWIISCLWGCFSEAAVTTAVFTKYPIAVATIPALTLSGC